MPTNFGFEGLVNGTDTGISASDATTNDSTVQVAIDFGAPGPITVADSYYYYDASGQIATGSSVWTFQATAHDDGSNNLSYAVTATLDLSTPNPTSPRNLNVVHHLSAALSFDYAQTVTYAPPNIDYGDGIGAIFDNIQYVHHSGVADQNYIFNFHGTLNVTVDQQGPSVSSFALDRSRSTVLFGSANPSYVDSQTVTYDLTFSENVYGLKPSDLSVVTAPSFPFPNFNFNSASRNAYIKSVTLDPSFAGSAQANAHYLVQVDTGQTAGAVQIAYNGTGGTDAAGNLSQASATSEIVDVYKPLDIPSPAAPDLVFASDTGASGTDNLTADTTPTFIGTATPGETVELLVDGALAATTVTTPSGVWHATVLTPLSNGQHQITVEKLTYGQLSYPSTPLTITIDPSQADAGAPAGAFQPEIQAASLSSGQGFTVAPPTSTSFLGAEIAAAGDLNGDGYADVAYVAEVTNPDGTHSGRVYVEYGAASGLANVSLGALGSHGFQINGMFAGSGNTITVASAGDVNGDGIDDLIVGEPGAGLNGHYSVGDAFVIYGSKAGPTNIDVTHLTPQQGFAIDGSIEYGGLGISVASAGDFNGDGIADVIVGSLDINGHGGVGGAYIVYGKLGTASNAPVDVGSLTAATGLHLVTPNDVNGRYNYQVGGLGDVNGDGYADVAITIGNAGPTYVVFGHATSASGAASFDVGNLNGTNGFTFGTSKYNFFNIGEEQVVAAGDINGDGYADILISAPDDQAYVVFGHAGGFPAHVQPGDLNGTNGFTITNAKAAGDASLSVVGHAGDVNGDGIDDLVVGDPTHQGGQAYVILGHQGAWGNVDVAGLNGANGFAVDLSQTNNYNLTVTGLGDVNGDGRADLGFATSDVAQVPSTKAAVVFDVMSAAPSRIATTSDTGLGGSGHVTSNTTPTITGVAEYGAAVKIYIDGQLAGTALTTPEPGTSMPTGETWTFTVPTILADGQHVFTATATDALGNVSPASNPLSITVDTTAPTVSGLTPLGQATTNATSVSYSLALSDPVAGIQLSDFSVTASGPTDATVTGFTALNPDAHGAASRYQVTVSSGSGDGTLALTYTSAHGTDTAGNPVALATIISSSTTIDKTAPSVLTATAAGAVGAAAADFTVTFTEPVLGVDASDFALDHTGTAGAAMTVSALSSTVYDVHLGDISGTGSLGLALASNAVITDAVGNPIELSNAMLATHAVDRDAPAKPAADGFSPDSATIGDHLTNAQDIVLTGMAEAGSTVTVYTDPYRPDFYVGDDQRPFNYAQGYSIATSQTTVADGSGHWTLTTPTLHDRSISYFWATATDAAGNTSIESDPLAVQVDQTPPVAIITAIQGATTNLALVGYNVAFSEPVSGISTASFSLTANGPTGAAIQSVTATDASHYVVTVATGTGDGTLQLVSTGGTDAAGNLVSTSYGDTYTVDRTPPDAAPQPQLFKTAGLYNGVTVGDVTNVNQISIVPQLDAPYTTFYVYDGNTLLGTANRESSYGFYYLNTTLSDGTHALTVRAVDAAGNIGAPSPARTVILDTHAPATPVAPTLDPSSADSNSTDSTRAVQPKLDGTAEAFSTVTLHDTDGSVIGRGTADATGNYSIASSPLSRGDHTVTVTASDQAGNTSGASSGLTAHIVLEPQNDTQTIANTVKADAGIAQAGSASLLANDLGGPNDHLVVTGIHFGTTGTDAPVDPTNGATINGTYGTLFVQQNGTWTFTPNAAFDNLPVGTTASDLFTYTVSDGAGHSATATLTLTEPAANLAPHIEAAGTTASGTLHAEDALLFGSNLVSNGDFSNGLSGWNASAAVSSDDLVALFGRAHGSYDPQTGLFQLIDGDLSQTLSLADGKSYLVEFTVSDIGASAGNGELILNWNGAAQALNGVSPAVLSPGPDPTTYSVMVDGSATTTLDFLVKDFDYGYVASPFKLDDVSVREMLPSHPLTTSGSVAFFDPDDTPVATVTPEGTGYLGTLALGTPDRDAETGEGSLGWTYTLTDPSVLRSLGAGEQITQTYDVTLTDGQGSQAHQTVMVTLDGANDAPTISGLAGSAITDEQTIQPFANASIADPDTHDVEQVTLTFNSGLGTLSNFGSGAFDSATGTYTTSGSAGAVTADLRGLIFTPTANLAPDTFTANYQDNFYGTHFKLSVSDGTTTVATAFGDQITPVNNPPVITSTPATGTVDLRLSPAPSNLLVNGSFETGDLTGWTLTTSSQNAPAPSVAADNPHDGGYAFDFASGTNGDVTLSQTVAVQPGLAYELSWWSDNNRASVQQGNSHNALYTVGPVRAVATDARGYTHYVQELVDAAIGNSAVTSTPVSVSVTKEYSSDNRVTHIDGISFQPVSFTATTSGTIAFTDPDPLSGPNVSGGNSQNAATATARGSGYLGTLSFDNSDVADGNIGWTFSLNSGDAASLAAGQTLTQTYDVAIGDDDGQVTPATTSVTVTITGANDAPTVVNHSAPTIVGPSAGVTVPTVDHGLLAGATDPDPGDAALLKVVSASAAGVSGTTPLINGAASVAGLYGTLMLHADGTYSYATDLAKLAGLDPHQMVKETFYYTAADPHGATSAAALTVQVFPHRAAVVTAQTATADVSQPLTVAAASGLLSGAADPDGDHPRVSAVAVTTSDGVVHSADVNGATTIDGVYGTLAVHLDGSYIYTTRADAVAAGQHATETFGFTVDDGWLVAGGDPTSTLSIDVTNYPVQVAPVIGMATEDGPISTLDALASAVSSNANAPLSVVNLPAALPAGVSYDADTNAFTLDPSNAAYQPLAAGQTTTVSVGYGVTNGTTTSAGSVSWTMSGVNDPAVIGGDLTKTLTDDNIAATITTTGKLTSADIDGTPNAFTAETMAGHYGTFVLGANGAYTYTASAGAFVGGQSYTDAFGITAADGTPATVTLYVNDKTLIFTSPSTVSVPEHTTAVAALTSTDADTVGTGPATFAITGGADATLFTVASVGGVQQLQFVAAPDYEAHASAAGTNAYQVEVTASDGTHTTPELITVNVTDQNDNAPVVTTAATQSVAEHTTVVAALTSTDADTVGTGPATFAITGGADATLFTVASVGGVQQLQFAAAPDYEAHASAAGTNAYQVEVTASDGTHTTPELITVNVTDQNDNAPVVTTAATQSVAEHTTVVAALTSTDADTVGTGPATFAITGGADATLFTVASVGGVQQLQFAAAPDYEAHASAAGTNAYQVEVTASDGTHTTPELITVNVTDQNDNAPVVTTAATQSVAEHTTVVAALTSTDADTVGTGPTTFAITGGADATLFTVASVGGVQQLQFAAAPDYEAHASAAGTNAYQVEVTASDGTHTTPELITVNVTDQNDNAPVVTTAATQSVAEHTTVVAALTSTDADTVGTGPTTFAITGGADATLFTVASVGGVQQLQFAAAPDYEAHASAAGTNAYQVEVTASDGTHTTPELITVNVTDQNDNAPVVITAATQILPPNVGASVIDGHPGGADMITGTSGVDTVSYAAAAAAASIDLGAHATWDGAHTDTLSSIENAIGSKFNDTIVGDAGDNVLAGGGGADHISGGGGTDTVSFASATGAVSIDLGAQLTWDGINNDTLSGIENAIGSKYDDTIVGDAANNVFDGGGGADHIAGAGGSDTISFASATGAVSIDLGAQLTWDGANNDTLSSIQNAIGSKFNDTIVGDSGNNVFDGGGGADHISGGGGVDTISFANSAAGVVVDLAAQLTWDGTNNDTLSSIASAIGSAHDDILIANTAGVSDVLTGGLGSDTFVFRTGFGHDAVSDFTAAGTAHDVLEVGHGLFAYDDPLAAAHDVSNGVVLVANDHEDITLLGMHKADLSISDFHFV